MNDNLEFGGDESFHVRADSAEPAAMNESGTPPAPAHQNGAAGPGSFRNGHASAPSIDPWSLADALVQRWPWIALGGLVMAALALLGGLTIWKTSYTANAQLVVNDSPTAVEVFGQRSISLPTFATVLRSADLLQRVSAVAQPPLSVDQLAAQVRVTPERNSEILLVSASASTPAAAARLANLYTEEAVRFTQEIQARQADEVNRYLKEQLAQFDKDIRAIEEQTQKQSRPSPPGQAAPIVPAPPVVNEKLQAARDELVDLLARYTEAFPLVQAQRAKINALEQQYGAKTSNAAPLGTNAAPQRVSVTPTAAAESWFAQNDPDRDLIRTKFQTLAGARLTLAGHQRAAQSLVDNAPGNFRMLVPATPREVVKQGRRTKVLFLAIFGGLMGLAGAVGLVLLIEAVDKHVKTASDVQRIARLPVLAALGDLRTMTLDAHDRWAFRTWTALQGKLSPSPNHGLVCGIMSSARGEGRSTWINLLARAANQRGFRVLTISTRPSPAHVEPCELLPNGNGSEKSSPSSSTALVANALASPAEVERKLMGPDPHPMVHIPLPGWAWSLERRKQWQAALKQWRKIENVVILIDLPPASVPEAMLLAEELPNLIWLADSGRAEAAETRAQLETLRHARCNLVGAVLNHSPGQSLRNRFPRWLSCAVLACAVTLSASGQDDGTKPEAAAQPAEAANTNAALSVTAPAKRAAWQERLTLGPGDVLTFSLFNAPELILNDVPIGPDGRVSFLEAQSILASGLTIDELRARFDEELAKYRRAARTIITPTSFHSKKYFVLGGVMQKGVFTLDRPITVIEAVARARGLETGLSDRTPVELPDFSRSFLARRGKRVPVDFAKLFQGGDLSQNVPLEPDDYLYFPVSTLKEVYVLGEVVFPGTVSFNPDLSVIGALSVRGGFTHRAWKKKVLVVRGSLNRPDTFTIDTAAVLSAKWPDFKLEPKDIIYVSYRPWIRAEELLDAAASAFVEAAVITFTGVHVGPFIK